MRTKIKAAHWFASLVAVAVVLLSASPKAASTQELRIKAAAGSAPAGVVLFASQGQNLVLTVTGTDASGKPMNLAGMAPKWSVDNPEVVSLDMSGVTTRIVAQQDGHAIVTVTARGQTATQRVAVGKARLELSAADVLPAFRVARLEIAAASANDPSDKLEGRALLLGENGHNLVLKARAFNAEGKPIPLTSLPVTWATEDGDVIELDNESSDQVMVIGRNPGETTVTATLQGVRVAVQAYTGDARNNASPALLTEKAIALTGAGPASLPITVRPSDGPANLPITVRPSEGPANLPITVRPSEGPANLPITVRPSVPLGGAPPVLTAAPPSNPQPPTPTQSATPSAASTNAAAPSGRVQSAPSSNKGGITGAGSGPLPAPTGVTARYIGEGRIAVRWTPVPDAAVYDMLARKPGENNWYPLTTQPIYKTSFITNPVTGIAVPAGAVEIVIVPRRDAQDNTGNRSTPVALNVPRYSGRYRVTVNGFRVNRETIDAPLNYDGQHDEVYVRVGVREYDGDGNARGQERTAQTRTHGDINAARWKQAGSATFRYPAGSASNLGGLISGNGYPSQEQPWVAPVATSNQRFPLFVWEGFLREGDNTVAIMPVIYEDDENMWELRPETQALLDLGGWVSARGYETIQDAGSAGETAIARNPIIQAKRLRFRTALGQLATVDLQRYFAVPNIALAKWKAMQMQATQQNTVLLKNIAATSSLLLNTKDRPIGMAGIEGGKIVFDPEIIRLTFETAEAFIASKEDPNSDIPPGIISIRYADTVPGGNGDYTLYIEVKRLQ